MDDYWQPAPSNNTVVLIIVILLILAAATILVIVFYNSNHSGSSTSEQKIDDNKAAEDDNKSSDDDDFDPGSAVKKNNNAIHSTLVPSVFQPKIDTKSTPLNVKPEVKHIDSSLSENTVDELARKHDLASVEELARQQDLASVDELARKQDLASVEEMARQQDLASVEDIIMSNDMGREIPAKLFSNSSSGSVIDINEEMMANFQLRNEGSSSDFSLENPNPPGEVTEPVAINRLVLTEGQQKIAPVVESKNTLVAQPKLTPVAQPKLTTVVQPKLTTVAQPKLTPVARPVLPQATKVSPYVPATKGVKLSSLGLDETFGVSVDASMTRPDNMSSDFSSLTEKTTVRNTRKKSAPVSRLNTGLDSKKDVNGNKPRMGPL